MSILLISTSTLHGGSYLDYVEPYVRDTLGSARTVLFVPYALADRDAYAAKARARFEAMGYGLTSLHAAPDPRRAVADADAVFIGGGNTFRLLKALYDSQVMGAIRQRVAAGMPYIGSSAGSNVACPTIKTTNDMPIVQPPSLDALGLVRFQVNPHYLDADPRSTHMGETREQRLLEFHEENTKPVVGLREGAMLRIAQDGAIALAGTAGARIFRVGQAPVEVSPGAALRGLLG